MTKTCRRCKADKPATTEFFGLNRRTPDGFSFDCRECKRNGMRFSRAAKARRKMREDKREREEKEWTPLSESMLMDPEYYRGYRIIHRSPIEDFV